MSTITLENIIRFKANTDSYPRKLLTNQQEMPSGGFVTAEETINITDTTLVLGGVSTTSRILAFRNLDPDNFVEVGLGAPYALKLLPGDYAQLRWNSGAVHARADAAPVQLEITYIAP